MSDVIVDVHTPTNNTPLSNFNNSNQINYFNCPNKLVTESIFEFFGMFIFISLSLGNVAIFSLYPSSQFNWTGMSIAWGLNLMFGIYIAGFKSPAHLNPVFTLCSYILDNNISFKQFIAYTFSQILGAFAGSAIVYGIYFNNLGDNDSYSGIFVTYKNPSISDTSAFFTEFLGTALLIGGIYMLIDNMKTNTHLPIYIGIWLTTLIFAFGFQTAFAWNPARDLGPRILTSIAGYNSFSYMDYYWWIPLVADYSGGFMGAIFYKYLIKQQME